MSGDRTAFWSDVFVYEGGNLLDRECRRWRGEDDGDGVSDGAALKKEG